MPGTAGGGKPSITGRRGQISGSLDFFGGPGTLWEFFEDGTVSISVLGNISGKYSWPDNSHLKIEFAQYYQGFVYEVTRSGDEITLTDPSTQTVIMLKGYKELSPGPQTLAGVWEKSSPDESECFLALGLEESPEQIEFGVDGTFAFQGAGLLSAISLYGQFSVSGNRLLISATGTKTETGLFGGTTEEQIDGELNCQITVSHSRLLFKDEQGRVTLYVRTQK